ncbi:MAG: extracellular solute-binding protein [Steroidobacteraceae bacterium]|jgi:iron(III) transport system substrate-binding protein|nr:extracellular solute-binding protein [Steroidobacteraceae bacterium]
MLERLSASRRWGLVVALTAVAVGAASLFALRAGAQGDALVVYSARKYQLVEELFREYGQLRGIEVKFITDDGAPLVARLRAEGRNSPADVLMTVDAGDLWRAQSAGLLQPAKSATLDANIPAHLRDPDGHWYGLSIRARTIAYAAQRVKPEDLSSYAALGEPRWKGRLCLRSGKHVYNQSLVAILIAEHGEAATERIVRSWVANLATAPFSNDTLLLEAIAAGQCDVGIVNSYYLGRLQAERPGFPVALRWADQAGSGVHVNISGAGITRFARNRAEALRFLEWLSTPAIQARFAGANFEFAANPGVEPPPVVAAWGPFRQNVINVGKAGELQPAAVRLMDRAGWK